jgi:pimeloyl-ACP methyl ester carboxylesterase
MKSAPAIRLASSFSALSTKEHDMDEITLERDGASLFAALRGNGRAIIFLHGGLANHESVLRYAGGLTSRFRVVAPDLRASGRSHYAGELSWAQLADDVAAIAAALGIDRAVIAGASFGAGVAIATALRHPALVDRLALLMPAFAGGDRPLTPAQAAAMQAMEAYGARAAAEGIESLLPIFDALPEPVRDRARATAATYDPASVAALTRFMNGGTQPFALAGELAAIIAPVIVVPGVDPTHPPEVAAHLAAHLPHAAICDASPDDYARVIEAWLAR